MDKQDELAAVIAKALPGPEHQKRRMVSEGVAHEIAAAVRSFMGSGELLDDLQWLGDEFESLSFYAESSSAFDCAGVQRFVSERERAMNVISRIRTAINGRCLRGALTAAIGEDIGGGRG